MVVLSCGAAPHLWGLHLRVCNVVGGGRKEGSIGCPALLWGAVMVGGTSSPPCAPQPATHRSPLPFSVLKEPFAGSFPPLLPPCSPGQIFVSREVRRGGGEELPSLPQGSQSFGGGVPNPPLFRAHSPQRHSGHLLALGCACSTGGSPGSCVTRGCVPTGARRSFLLRPFHHPASLRGEGRARRRQIGTCWLCEMAAGQQGKVHVCVCVCAGRAEPPAAAGMLSGAAFGFVRILNGEGRRGAQGAKRGGGGDERGTARAGFPLGNGFSLNASF